MSDLKPHGSTAAYRRHKRHGEEPCASCKAAWAEWTRNYRATSADAKAKKASYERARHRATKRLIDAHRREFETMLAQEIAEAAG